MNARMLTVNSVRRAALAYYRANVDAWEAVRRRIPVFDPWAYAGTLLLAAVVALIGCGHTGTAMLVAAAGLWLPVLQRLTDR